jgi:hypothetical protein
MLQNNRLQVGSYLYDSMISYPLSRGLKKYQETEIFISMLSLQESLML